jgi:hypothetical protein
MPELLSLPMLLLLLLLHGLCPAACEAGNIRAGHDESCMASAHHLLLIMQHQCQAMIRSVLICLLVAESLPTPGSTPK